MDTVALGALSALLTPPACDPRTIEHFARDVHAARLGLGIDGLALGQGLSVERVRDFPVLAFTRTAEHRIMIRVGLTPTIERVVIARQLAGVVARCAGHALSDADTWRLALALLAPANDLHGATPDTLAHHETIPRWAAAARLREATQILAA